MFRTIPISIIRSFSLFTQQWYMSYRFADKTYHDARSPESEIYKIYIIFALDFGPAQISNVNR